MSYEDLVQNQEAGTRQLLDFCGLEWDERCLAFFKTRRVVRTASCLQVRRPISTRAIGRWQHYRSHLGPLFTALNRAVEREPSSCYRTDMHSGLPWTKVLSNLKNHPTTEKTG
jgi:hypothetical protein